MTSQTDLGLADRVGLSLAPAEPRTSRYDPARVVFLTRDEWLSKPVASLLDRERYQLTVVGDPHALVEHFLHGHTDAVLLDLRVPLESGTDIGALLWEVPREPTIPVIGIGSQTTSRSTRLDALNAGVWDVIEFPLPPAELVAKLDTYVWLKRHYDEMSAGVLLDLETSHYSMRGIKRRLRELVALVQRSEEAFSCVLFGADPLPEQAVITTRVLREAGRKFSLALHHQTRSSDVVGRLEPLKFGVLAPKTPPDGALKLAERLTTWSLNRNMAGELPVTFSAGVAGIAGANGQVYAQPELLLTAAHRALNAARAEGAGQVSLA